MAGLVGKTFSCVLICLFLTQCGAPPATPDGGSDPAASRATAAGTADGPILPIPSAASLSPAKVDLGRRLFHETALSGVQRKISCATCHPLDQGGTRGMMESDGGDGQMDEYDIPTVFNTAEHFSYFWSGRAQSLEAVVQSSIRSKNVMDASWPEVLNNLTASGDYGDSFQELYPESGLSMESVEDALVTFLMSLNTPNAAFDRWLNGEEIPERVLEGYALFKEIGCARCHQGASVGGNMYASFAAYLESRDTIRTSDLGRYNVTNNESHKYQFKVPSLRNVAATAPYFHDGSVNRLDDAVETMALYQLDRELKSGEVDLIVSFLESLTGWYDERIVSSNREGGTP